MWVSADEIEQAVFVQLFSLYGDSISIENAIKRSVDRHGNSEKIRKEIELFQGELKSVASKLKNLVNAVTEGALSSDDIKEKRESLQAQQDKIEKEIAINEKKIQNVPSPAKIKEQGKFIQQVLKKAAKNRFGRGEHYLKMTW